MRLKEHGQDVLVLEKIPTNTQAEDGTIQSHYKSVSQRRVQSHCDLSRAEPVKGVKQGTPLKFQCLQIVPLEIALRPKLGPPLESVCQSEYQLYLAILGLSIINSTCVSGPVREKQHQERVAMILISLQIRPPSLGVRHTWRHPASQFAQRLGTLCLVSRVLCPFARQFVGNASGHSPRDGTQRI